MFIFRILLCENGPLFTIRFYISTTRVLSLTIFPLQFICRPNAGFFLQPGKGFRPTSTDPGLGVPQGEEGSQGPQNRGRDRTIWDFSNIDVGQGGGIACSGTRGRRARRSSGAWCGSQRTTAPLTWFRMHDQAVGWPCVWVFCVFGEFLRWLHKRLFLTIKLLLFQPHKCLFHLLGFFSVKTKPVIPDFLSI